MTETLTAEGGAARTTAYRYDRFDRLIHQTDHFGQTVSYSYDDNGNRTRLLSSAGHVTQYRYDRRNRLSSVATQDGETRYSYRRTDQLSGIAYPHGGVSDYHYDTGHRLTSLVHRHHGGEVARYGYQYDGNGNRTQQTEHNGFGEEITTYTYDAADRLQAVHYPDKAEAYTFDAAWNRVTETVTDL
ncbi:hypothetical protein K8B33_15985, partial [Alcanivorax sp. JB21]|uniref:hypothetical protein n=1 Tax=Alcanivorax limicola TaxID=2874102 RepID=UPI001CC0BAC7